MTTRELSPRLCDSKAHGLSSWEKNRLEFETSQLFSQINPKHRNLTMGSRVGGQIVQTRVGQLWFCKGWTAHKAPLWRKPWMCGRSPRHFLYPIGNKTLPRVKHLCTSRLTTACPTYCHLPPSLFLPRKSYHSKLSVNHPLAFPFKCHRLGLSRNLHLG